MLHALRLRLWHRLLTPGWRRPTAAARLRGWSRVIEWRRAAARGQRGRLLKRAVWRPVRVWRQAAADVAAIGAEVTAVSGVSAERQRRDLWWLEVRHGLTVASYVDCALYRPERRRRAAAYLEQTEHARTVWWLLAQRPAEGGFPGRDKTALPDWCARHGLPTIPILLQYEGGELAASTLGDDPAAALPAADLFTKPSDSQYGADSARWRHVGSGGWVGPDGATRDATALLEELARLSRELRRRDPARPNRLLVQPALRNHAALRALAPGALCTARILTCRAPDGPGTIVLAAYRLAVGGAPADNFHFGGIIAPVDLATGRLGPALRRRRHVLADVERHPDTGVAIEGTVLPHWEAAKALALRAFAAAPERVTVGWDVAILEDGPVLVEGNTASHPDIAQATSRRPLGDTPYVAAIEAHVRRAMGLGS